MSVKGWTVERETLARKMWRAGHSAGEIARALNCGMSRNAVVGKLNRMGLVGRAAPSRPKPKPVKAAPPPAPPPAPPSPPVELSAAATAKRGRPKGRPQQARTTARPAPAAPPPAPAPAPAGEASRERDRAPGLMARTDAPDGAEDSKTIPFLEARHDQCSWPVGDPRDADFAVCGAKVRPGKPYCGAHCAIAYQPIARRGAA